MGDVDDSNYVYVHPLPTGTRWKHRNENSPANIARRITLPFHATTAESRQEAKSQCFHDLIAGAVAGSAGVVVGHPFDTVKVRMQMATHSPSFPASALQLNGLMRGIAGRQTRGLPTAARLHVADNTGAKIVQIINILKLFII